MGEFELTEAEDIAVGTLSVLFFLDDEQKEYEFAVVEIDGSETYDVVGFTASDDATSDEVDCIVGALSIATNRSHGLLFILYPLLMVIRVPLIRISE